MHEYPHAIDVFRRLDGLEALAMMQRGEVPKTNVNVWMNFSLETVERGHVVFTQSCTLAKGGSPSPVSTSLTSMSGSTTGSCSSGTGIPRCWGSQLSQ